MKSKEHYIEKYNKRWNECFDEVSKSGSNDPGYDATSMPENLSRKPSKISSVN